MTRRVLRVLALTLALVTMSLAGGWLALRRPTVGSLDDLGQRPADPQLLRAHTEFLSTELGPRGSDQPEVLARAADYIEAALEPTTERVRRQTYEARGHEYHNVVADYGPATGPRIVIGAHYDAFTSFGPNPGADDNASGTAGLLELGRLLGGATPGLPVTIVAYTLEEPPYFRSPLMGSRVHADSLGAEAIELWGMINLEMIGYYTDEQPWTSRLLDLYYPDHGDFVALVGRPRDAWLSGHLKRAFRGASDLPVYSFNGPVVMGIDASDHRSYWHNGYDAIMVTDTAFQRNPHYHSPGDRPETLDYERMAEVVEGVLNAVLHARPR